MKPWHCLVAIGAAAPSFAACYTYNIYLDDGGAGGASTGTTVTSSADSTTSSDSSSSTMASSSSGVFNCDSTGFLDAVVPNAATCPFTDGAINLMMDGPPVGWCTLRHASEDAPFIEGAKLRLDTRCSEWTPHGFGPFVYKSLAAPDQDFAVWGTFEFDGEPLKNYHGGGVLFRWGPLADGQNYALVSIFRHPNAGGTPTVGLWHGDDAGFPKLENPNQFPGSYDGVRIGLCARKSGATAPNTHVISAYYRIPQGGFTLMSSFEAQISGAVEIGAVSHVPQGGQLIPHVSSLGVAARLQSADPCFDGQLGPMN